MEDNLKTQCPPKDSQNTLFSMALDVPTFQAQQEDEKSIMTKLYKNRLKSFEEVNNTFILDPEYSYPSEPTYPIHTRENNNLRLLGLESKTSTIIGDLILPLTELFGEQLKEEVYLHTLSTAYKKQQFGVDGLFGELIVSQSGHTSAQMPHHMQPLPPLTTALYLPKRNAGLEFKKLMKCSLIDSGEPQKLTPREYYNKLLKYIEKLQEKIQKDIAFVKQKGSNMDVDTLEAKKKLLQDEENTNIFNFFEEDIETNTILQFVKQFAAYKDISVFDTIKELIEGILHIKLEDEEQIDEEDYEEYFNEGVKALYEAEEYNKVIQEENGNTKVKRNTRVLALKGKEGSLHNIFRQFNRPKLPVRPALPGEELKPVLPINNAFGNINAIRLNALHGGGSRKNRKLKNNRKTRRNGRS